MITLKPHQALIVCGVFIAALTFFDCNHQSSPPAGEKPVTSQVAVAVEGDHSITIKTSSAEFSVLPSGYIQGFLLKDGKRLTLDEPASGLAEGADSVTVSGKPTGSFALDFSKVKVSEAHGKLGPTGKRIEITGKSSGSTQGGIEKTLALEVYDDFPDLLIATESYRNTGTSDLNLGNVNTFNHRFSASLVDPKVAPYQLWSFQGSSFEWGVDEVRLLTKGFSQSNEMGAIVKGGMGGGIPVVAFWTATVGEAIGHLETLPLAVSFPVRVAPDGMVTAAMSLDADTTLKPDEVYSTPRSFLAVYSGDYFEPLRMYSRALQSEGWSLPKPDDQDYNVSWCGWGYESQVTPAQMLGTIPKLLEFHIKWATLDDRWFNNYGDWKPRSDTFPDDAIKNLVQDFHQKGISMQIWWLPLGVEDGQGGYEAHRYGVSQAVKDHPDWLILDKSGKHARMVRNLAALCPALPEVQEYYKQLTTKFIRDWGFDGHKLDNIYTVPECYNPKHHHKSPMDSVYAMRDVYKVIFETTRALKPQSVTQSCPCGTPPSIAWLPYMDQAVTADPVGAEQVRRRIKMYKALLGPQAAVYGDHVELSDMPTVNGQQIEVGKDFASTVGAGGVVGTKFTWPDYGPKFSRVYLNPEKEMYWKKWIGIYDDKMLSKGTFLNLYTIGYDVPEGYAIAKNGKMYYAFFVPKSTREWTGDVELRGLQPGKYRVYDYEHDKDLGSVEGTNPQLHATFAEHLMLEVSKEQ
jgi:alpha-galactosidase